MKKVLQLALLLAASVILSACNPLSKPKKAGLQVNANNIPSTVFINGDYLEKTPLVRRDLQPGTYNIKLQPDDPEYVPYETNITLREGTLAVMNWRPARRAELSGGVIFEMEPIKSSTTSEVSVVSIPDGALVKLGDREKEFSPVLFQNLTPGQAQLEITLPSYEMHQINLDMPAGYRLIVNAKLAKENPADEAGAEAGNQSSDTPESPSAATESSALGAPSTREQAIAGQASSSASTNANANPSGPAVTITATGFFMNGREVLRVRDRAGAVGAEIGFAPVGNSYPYLGETTSGWHKVNFEGQEGWVSGTYSTLSE